MMKRLKILVVAVMVTMFGWQTLAMAAGTVLPMSSSIKDGPFSCEGLINTFNNSGKFATPEVRDDTLGCAIMSGRISLAMIPYYIQYLSNYFLGMVSLIALLFTVIGGFLYITSGLVASQKDKGKTYITNALFGMGMAFLAWSVINVVVSAIT